MKYFEFGRENEELMVLLHGGLVGENTERFIEEVDKAHRHARQKEEKHDIPGTGKDHKADAVDHPCHDPVHNRRLLHGP